MIMAMLARLYLFSYIKVLGCTHMSITVARLINLGELLGYNVLAQLILRASHEFCVASAGC